MNETYVRKQIARYNRETGYGRDDALYLIANHCNITRAVNFDEMTEAEKSMTKAFIRDFERRQGNG